MKGICVGLGGRGRSWVEWARQAGIEVVGVVEREPQRLAEGAAAVGVDQRAAFTSVAQAAAATEARVATVCTASPHHAAAVMECLDAGLHAIVEKPMVETPDEAAALLAKIRQTGRRVACSQILRYMGPIRAMRQAVHDGRLGRIVTASVGFSRWRPSRGLHLPLMLNQGIHHFDALRFILGADPLWALAHSWNPSHSQTDGPTVLQAIWGFAPGPTGVASTDDDGFAVTYNGSYVGQGAQTSYLGVWRIEGEKGSLTYYPGHDDDAVLLQQGVEGKPEALPVPERDATMSEPALVTRDFLNAIEAGGPCPTEAQDNVRSLAMAWAAAASAQASRQVAIDEILPGA